MSRNNDIHNMYVEELEKVELLKKEIKNLKLEKSILKDELRNCEVKLTNKFAKEAEKYICKINELENQNKCYLNEIERLKNEIENKNYSIDKLECSNNKNSSNSGIPTSKEIVKNSNSKSSPNTYNHREKSSKNTGGQNGHKGNTFTKNKIEELIKKKNVEVINITHYINEDSNQMSIIKYKVGVKLITIVERHIFKYSEESKEQLPKEFYHDVSYTNEFKSLIVLMGNYYSLGYRKIKEMLYDFSNGIINLSEGTINNVYREFSKKSDGSIQNIIKNLINGKYQHTDETVTKENGKASYYRGYANKENVLYKYHHHRGDKPINDDGIINNFYGTIISDHEVGVFKYGINNQDCIIHIGRYCKEAEQNITETNWQIELYYLLLKIERERVILKKYGREKFEDEEIKIIESDYDKIIEIAKQQNAEISSSYWRKEEEKLLSRLIKHKDKVLFYVHDFKIPYDNNHMERLLRMIKGKTKVSGGFRSDEGGIMFGNTMSILKTAKLRNLNILDCVNQIFKGKALFA